MKNNSALFIVTVIMFACGDSTPPKTPTTDQDDKPFAYLVPCTLVEDDTGEIRSIDGDFEVTLSSVMYGGGERTWTTFSFTIRAANGPNCRAIELRELPFQISGNKVNHPPFETWVLHNRTHERRGILAQGILDKPLIQIDPKLLLHPGDEVELTLAINCSSAQQGQRFHLEFQGPIIWRVWNEHEEHVRLLDPPLEAIYVF